jgi:hypothetical protein
MKKTNLQTTEKKSMCESCPIRKKAEANPKTLFARIWRWHTGWCPGWKAYQAQQAPQGKS